MPSELELYRHVQTIARGVLRDLEGFVCPGATERSIAAYAVALLRERGVTETWYYDCPAFVLLGSRSCLSISGREYIPADEPVGNTNLVTVDLSPKKDTFWGDCARSFFIEQGKYTADPAHDEFARGKQFLETLHSRMPRFVDTNTTFHELFCWANAEIESNGFENLDFAQNVGHSIATRNADRQYIERGNGKRLTDVQFFTFEPHVRMRGGAWGFKHENIFYFDGSGHLKEL